jgi:hypothetical protein
MGPVLHTAGGAHFLLGSVSPPVYAISRSGSTTFFTVCALDMM